MTHESIDWNDPEAVEALLAAEGLGDIDEAINNTDDVHIGVGRSAMAAASASEADRADFAEDTEEASIDLDAIMGE